MNDMSETRRCGRPKIDDREQIVAFVVHGLKQGRSLSDVTKNGMTIIVRQQLNDDGTVSPTEVRRIDGPTLARRYRAERAPFADDFIRMSSAFLRPDTRLIGITAPRSMAFCQDQPLARGRPKKRRPK